MTLCVCGLTTKWPSGESHVFVVVISLLIKIFLMLLDGRCQEGRYLIYNLLFFPFMMLPNLKLETFGLLFNLQNSKGVRGKNSKLCACFYLPAFSSSFNI